MLFQLGTLHIYINICFIIYKLKKYTFNYLLIKNSSCILLLSNKKNFKCYRARSRVVANLWFAAGESKYINLYIPVYIFIYIYSMY